MWGCFCKIVRWFGLLFGFRWVLGFFVGWVVGWVGKVTWSFVYSLLDRGFLARIRVFNGSACSNIIIFAIGSSFVSIAILTFIVVLVPIFDFIVNTYFSTFPFLSNSIYFSLIFPSNSSSFPILPSPFIFPSLFMILFLFESESPIIIHIDTNSTILLCSIQSGHNTIRL